MRRHNWMYKVITTYTDGMTGIAYFSDYTGVKLHKMGVLVAESELHQVSSIRILPYGGAIA